jgi:UDP-3-O-[3-hydroxymyristoyl] glucosamine N-acyltransferase
MTMPADPERAIELEELGRFVDGQMLGDTGVRVSGVSSLEQAGPDDLSFVADARHVKTALQSRAAAFVVGQPVPDLRRPQILVRNPAYAFARITQQFFMSPHRARGIAEQVVRGTDVQIGREVSVWPFVTLGDRVTIGDGVSLYPGVFIGEDSSIGADSIVYPNVTIRERCRIGSRVIIHSGSVIGSDGFGYAQHQGRHQKIPQLGGVVIEDDVELGANVTVDRGTFGDTLIKRGTKVDNLVQIAHNVTVGEDCILVAQVGIAGSSTLGHHVIVGGQAGLSDHVRIGDGVMIAARTGVNRSLTGGQIVSGAPVMPHQDWVKAQAVIPRLPELRQRVRELEHRLRDLESPKPAREKAKGKGKRITRRTRK